MSHPLKLSWPKGALLLGFATTVACSTKPDDSRANDELVAGGQSGTDASGTSSCALKPDEAYEISLQDTIEHLDITPYDALVRVHGRRALGNEQCDMTDSLLLDVVSGGVARVVPGTLALESGEQAECEAVDLDVDAHVSSSDGSIDADSSLLRLWPMRLRPIADMVFQGPPLVSMQFDLRDFAERERNDTWRVVFAIVYPSGEVDENGFVISGDPDPTGTYADVGVSCRGFPPNPNDP